MKKISIIFVLAMLVTMINTSFSQDNASYDAQKRALIGTQVAPDYTPRAPVKNENSIPFLTNCVPQDRPTCLKEPFDSATWTIVPFTNGVPPAYRNDDGSSPLIALGFTFNLYGTNYTSCYINNNGNITFSAPLSTFTPSAFPSTTFGAIVAPFFADVDTRPLGSGLVYYKLEPNRMTVVWDSTGYFGNHTDKLNTFQLIISNGLDPVVGIGNNVCFSYGDMEWTTGDASGGSGGFGPPGTAATIGVNEGNGIDYATLGRFCRPGIYYGGPSIDTNGVSYLDCQNFCLDASNAGNICPVASGFPSDTVIINAGTPYNAVYSMSAPEITQITSGGVSGVPPGMTVTIANALTCTFTVSWDPSCTQAGTYTVCFAGTDNATDPCTTTVCVVYRVVCQQPPICDPGTPHIEILDHPDDPVTHLEGRYIYQREYLPYFPNDTAFAENHCGLNVLKPVDPCNPWVLEFYVAYFEDEDDMIKVLRPEFNWDTLSCQDMRFEVVYPAGFDYTYSTYYDSVVMKVTMIPHATDTCTLPPENYTCIDSQVVTNYACWVNCMNELLTFRCIDSCEVPNEAICRMEFDKPLPVELNSFTAIAENENVLLNWSTVTEKDNAGFDIERRSDGIWTKIGYVSGKGNSDVSVDYAFIDRKLNSGSYGYRLKQIDFNGNFEYYDLSGYVNIGVPDKFRLSQNYPNPFNPVTKIDFTLPISENVMLKIYDLSGREIVTILNEFRTAGYYTVDFNAANLASGIYYYKLTAGNNTAVNKMVVIK